VLEPGATGSLDEASACRQELAPGLRAALAVGVHAFRAAPTGVIPKWTTTSRSRCGCTVATPLSLLVSRHGNANEAVWLRKSKLVGERAIDSTTVELTMPDWLARSEKLS
jgi:hypothetical protein